MESNSPLLESGLAGDLLSPMEYGRSDTVPLLGSAFKRPGSFCFHLLRTSYHAVKMSWVSSWREKTCGEKLKYYTVRVTAWQRTGTPQLTANAMAQTLQESLLELPNHPSHPLDALA